MKFGEYFIPAGTEARVINTPKYKEAGVPGLDLYLAISFLDIQLIQRKSVPINEIEIKDELGKNNRDAVMTGLTYHGASPVGSRLRLCVHDYKNHFGMTQ